MGFVASLAAEYLQLAHPPDFSIHRRHTDSLHKDFEQILLKSKYSNLPWIIIHEFTKCWTLTFDQKIRHDLCTNMSAVTSSGDDLYQPPENLETREA